MSSTCLVTGANSGIGLAIARQMARLGWRVLMLCRDPERGAAARDLVRSGAEDPARVELVLGDLGTVRQTQAAAQAVLEAAPRLDALVHNAGIWPTRLVRNDEGFERAFAVNHLAPFVLTRTLLPRLLASADPRIVQVTAGLYPLGRVDLEATPTGKDFGFKTYAHTKLWNLIATHDLARTHADSPLAVVSVHPGVVRTGLGDEPHWTRPLLRLAKRFWAEPEQGARGPVLAATEPRLAGRKGVYLNETEEEELKPPANTPGLGSSLVARTEALLAGIRNHAGHDSPGTSR